MVLCNGISESFLETSQVIRTLGSGSYGSVSLRQHESGILTAVKVQTYGHQEKGILQSALIEVDTLVRLKPLSNVVQIIGTCIFPNLNKLAIILEPMDYSLRDFIHTNPIEIRLQWLYNLINDYMITSAILEKLNINHFDINAANILIKWVNGKPIFKLSDFGLSRSSFQGNVSSREIVTVPYRSPEILTKRRRSEFPESVIDVWSFGVTLFEYLTGTFPYIEYTVPSAILNEMSVWTNIPNFSQLAQAGLLHGSFPAVEIMKSVYGINLPLPYEEFIRRLFKLNPNERPKPTDLVPHIPSEYIQLLQPAKYSRKIGSQTLFIFRNAKITDSYIVLVMAIEIVTRYYGLIKDIPFNEYNVLAAATHIASTYVSDRPISLQDAGKKYGLRGKKVTEYIENEEQQILWKLGFLVYNSSLTNSLNLLYFKFHGNNAEIVRYLNSLSSIYFLNDVSLWFN